MYSRILVVKLSDIGDVLTATPALRALRQTFAAAHIDVLVPPRSAVALRDSRLVDELIVFDKFEYDRVSAALAPSSLAAALRLFRQIRARRYDALVLLHHLSTRWGALKWAALALASGAPVRAGLDNGRGWFLTHRVPDEGFGAKHEVEHCLAVVNAIGAVTGNTRLEMPVSDEDMAAARRLAVVHGLAAPAGASNPPARLVMLHPGGGGHSPARRWPLERWVALGRALAEVHGARVVVAGTAGDRGDELAARLPGALNLTGRTSLAQLAALMPRCDLFVGADSGVLHVAAAAGVPLVALFGTTNARAWGPWQASGVVVQSQMPGCPCAYVGLRIHSGACEARRCMEGISVESVLGAVEQVLGNGDSAHVQGVQSLQPRDIPRSITLLGVRVDDVTFAETLALMEAFVADARPHQVCTVNPEFIMAAQRDREFFEILSRSDLNIPDGGFLLWAARRAGTRLRERVTGSDTLPLFAEVAARKGYRLYLLGASPGVAEQAAQVLQRTWPALQIAGMYGGSPAADEEEAIVARVRAAAPHVLFVAYGAPQQDKWIARNAQRLGVPLMMGVGGSLDFIAGTVPRAPRWLQRLGLEWLFRLAREPWRWRRQVAIWQFAWLTLLGRVKT